MNSTTIRMRRVGLILAMLALLAGAAPAGAVAQTRDEKHHGQGTSPYAGEENRAIKSLSPGDIAELKAGRGWGLAKAAELNGVPGPAHLLELKSELGLSSVQIAQIERIYTDMQREARRLGPQLIELERRLNAQFSDGVMDETGLRDLLEQIGRTRTALRFTHLQTHLRTPAILTAQQTARYQALRGYSGQTPGKAAFN